MSTAKLINSEQQISRPVARGNEDGNMNGTIESDHTVVVDESVTPNALRFSAVFNVAVSFIDRHITEGRGTHVALRHDADEITYAQLAENVGRAGNALLKLGLIPGDRLVMAALDAPDVLLCLLGRHQSRDNSDCR